MNRKKLGMNREVVRVLTADNMLGVAGGVTTRPPETINKPRCTNTLHGGSVCAPDTQNECP
jgi:hypothetical protein